MVFHYNVKGEKRKELVEAVAEILSTEILYKGSPTFAYEVGTHMIDKNGMLVCNPDSTPEDIQALVQALAERGFTASDAPKPSKKSAKKTSPKTQNDAAVTPSDSSTENESPETCTFAVQVPRSYLPAEALEKLEKVIASKATLFMKSLNAESLPLEIDEEQVSFPWFTLTGIPDEANSYTQFVHGLCEMAKRQKRVTAVAREPENEKFAMRVFLIRLGFIGDEYSAARKLLLSRLTGNSSFKSGHPPEKPTVPKQEAVAP